MDRKIREAYRIVFADMTKVNLFKGIYDGKNGNKSFMYGISTVMEYIASNVNKQTVDNFSEIFIKNMIKSEIKD